MQEKTVYSMGCKNSFVSFWYYSWLYHFISFGEVRLLNSRSEYSRCSLPRLVIEDSHEKAESDKVPEKEEERNSENVNERDPAAVSLNPTKTSSSGKIRKTAKTNRQNDQSADIRTYFNFKSQKSDRGVT